MTIRAACTCLTLLLLSACANDGSEGTLSYDGPVTPAAWNTNATAFREQPGLVAAFSCPKNEAQAGVGLVWGTGVFSDDSSVCAAGVHAGAISFEDGGTVVFEILPGQGGYQASTQNGVASSAWGSWHGSFSVRR